MNAPQKLLILYTGGTIGMRNQANGLAPDNTLQQHLPALIASLPPQTQPATWLWQECKPLIDSANMTTQHWLSMRQHISHAVDSLHCDSILVLHGTDTMTWSAAALACLLCELPVPVLLTGAMQPFAQANSDAANNLLGALSALANNPPAAVWLYFHQQLFNACQIRKRSAHDHNAFCALPHAPPHPTAALPTYRQTIRPVRLALLTLFPGFQTAFLRSALEHCDAIVLECYGCGTVPTNDPEFTQTLEDARQRGIIIAAISQCEHAQLNFNTYAAGAALHNAGVLNGSGMHRELALARLFTLVGAGYTNQQIAQHFPLPTHA